MIYSKWRPDTGQYDYYEAPERRGLGDDLPTPRLPLGTSVGVASNTVGRKVPLAARRAGSGELPRGSIAPTSRAGLAGVTGMLDVMPLWMWVATGITVGWVLARKWKS